MEVRECRTCLAEKSIEEFDMAYGEYRRWHCNGCFNGKRRRSYRDDPLVRQQRTDDNTRSYIANYESIREGQRVYRENHREADRESSRQWRKDNPQKVRDLSSKHKALRRGALDGELIDRNAVWERDKGICGICNQEIEDATWHLDHIIPVSKGGKHVYANVQSTHASCNLRKGANILGVKLP